MIPDTYRTEPVPEYWNLQGAYRKDIVAQQRLFVPAGLGRDAFVDVRDVAAVAALVFESPERFERQALTLTGPEGLTFHDVARVLSTVLGRPTRYEPATVARYMLHLRREHRLQWVQVFKQTLLHVRLRYGDAERVDPTLAQLLGRPPRTVRDYVEYAAHTWKV